MALVQLNNLKQNKKMAGIRAVNNRLKSTFASEELRMQGLLKKRKESLETFLINFFTNYNLNKNTLFVSTGEVQTVPGKRRSIGDIYAICKYYYPNCTIKKVVDIVYNVLPQEVPRFRSSKCKMIKKRVFYQGSEEQSSAFYDTDSKDEFELTIEEWKNL